ncbi:glycosyltransferase family 2 protein [Pelagibacterales bacterium]|nr:glycosyltransferase family 2 protein [Pelagibacterales bacterium]
MKLSIQILTYNEENNIEQCLESIKGLSDDIIIIDSNSNDKTLEICKKYKCKIFSNKFVNHGIQRNWGIKNVKYQYDWILFLDADERLTSALEKEIKRFEDTGEYDFIKFKKKMFWMNKLLRFGGMSNQFKDRIGRVGNCSFEEITEEHLLVNNKVLKMKNYFYENNQNNNLDYFTKKHLCTAQGEIEELLNPNFETYKIKSNLFGDRVQRLRWIKLNVYNLSPLFIRPFIYFFYRYIILLGFLDGKRGLIFHLLQGFWYRFYIDSLLYQAKVEKHFKSEIK